VLGTLALSFISALVFTLFWIGVALLVLLPTLFITVSLAIMTWVWAVSSFVVARWVYDAMPISRHGKTEVALQNGKKTVANNIGGGYGDVKDEIKDGY
jgi:membrane protein implicated in regulation of membrane protease activity